MESRIREVRQRGKLQACEATRTRKAPLRQEASERKGATKNSGGKAKLQTAHGADEEQQVLGTCPTSGGGREQISERIHVRFSYVK